MLKVTQLLGLAALACTLHVGTLTAQDTIYTVNLGIPSETNVALDRQCAFKLQVSNVLRGDFDADGDGNLPPDSLFTIIVEDDDPSNGPVIDGCGRYDFTISNADTARLRGFNATGGTINAFDVTPPGLRDLPRPSTNLLYTGDLNRLNINNLPRSVPRTFTVDRRSGDILDIDSALLRILEMSGDIPMFFDSCSNMEVEVRDFINMGNSCDGIRITRIFTARDNQGSCDPAPVSMLVVPMETSISYQIELVRPDIDSVSAPPAVITVDCDDPRVVGNPTANPKPQREDYPFLRGMDTMFFLDNTFGNVGATFEDSERIITCAGTYKVIRTYTVVDWCNPADVRTYTQILKVGNTDVPTIVPPMIDADGDLITDIPLIFSTNAPGCGAFLNTNFGGFSVTSGCSPLAAVEAYVFVNGDTNNIIGPAFPTSRNPQLWLTPFVPAGDHVLRYTAGDQCGNDTLVDVRVRIEDNSGPVVIIDDALNVSLNNNGFAVVRATDFDPDGRSYDDCTDVTLNIAFASPNSLVVIGDFAPEITLTCVDEGTVTIIIQATDENGNTNNRTATINVIDNNAPICVAPAPMTITCNEFADLLPTEAEGIQSYFDADPAGTALALDGVFGEAASIDNCGDPVVGQTLVTNFNTCGGGTLTRVFSVRDGQGFASAPGCQQVVTIRNFSDYTVSFPADMAVTCGKDVDYGTVTITENSCEMILLNTEVDTFRTQVDECYKLRITYSIINWCEYDGVSDFIPIDRDPDGDGFSDEITYLHVDPNGNTDPVDDVAYLDTDSIRSNDNALRAVLDSSQVYGTSGSRGAFQYRQFVKVFDETAPTITNIASDVTPGAGCESNGIQIEFSALDDCSQSGLEITVELDLDHAGTFSTSRLLSEEVTTEGGGNYNVLLDNLPNGEHALRVRANDGCGNLSGRIIPFDVQSNGSVSPICIGDLAFVLMNDGGGGGIARVEAEEFVISANGNCDDLPVSYSVYRESEYSAEGFEPRGGRASFLVGCEDLGTIPVRVYAIVGGRVRDYCSAGAVIEAFNDNVCAETGVGSLAGFITTPQDELLMGIEMRITDYGEMNEMQLTDQNGSFLFAGLEEGHEYMVKPSLPDVVDLRSVKTSDLIVLANHIVGARAITDPYRLLAGDANSDGQIDILDMVAIRRVILGLEPHFRGSPAWRFVRTDHDLSALPTKAWNPADLPDTYEVDELVGHDRNGDFYAIEIGNVHQDANGRSASPSLVAQDRFLRAGETTTIHFRGAELRGIQGTFRAEKGLKIVDVFGEQLSDNQVNKTYLADGIVGFSSHGPSGRALSLHVRAEQDLWISNYLSVTDRLVVSEGYDATESTGPLGLAFTSAPDGAGIVLHQNFPNPVADQTTIQFDLPEPLAATLEVRDLSGRLVHRRSLRGTAGRNTLRLTHEELNLAAGVLTYTLRAGSEIRTKRLTILAR